ncbi:hypothetical protein [Ferruginibacter sp. HRS2-29]|uniref:hypothetical protein n=1 Tax=Ferruginibacter sp. HRS2-29 TaxID=2487334 RepID=UPI0020CFDC5F|nr:hypothetical protein [Ferruginibacter sp. HRS2-29]MCP9749474.1 hypothetical protein [Ferruginibacter sp. HRS2-29]
MKKLLAIVAITAFMAACNDEKKTEVTVTTDSNTTKMSADTTTVTPAAKDTTVKVPADTTKAAADTSKKK